MVDDLESELEAAMSLSRDEEQPRQRAKPQVDASMSMDYVTDMVDMKALADVYTQDLKQLQAARTDMMKKAHWIENTIKLLDRRIAINLEALKTLQTPHEHKPADHKIIDQ